MMKNNIAIGIVVAVAVGVVITGSTLTAVSAQGNMTAGGGDIQQKLMSAAANAKALGAIINNKDLYVVACDPSFTDPGTQCEVYNVAKEPHQ